MVITLVLHNIPPLYDRNSRILILGSFPSVKSRETEFFYAHPQNRFWRILENIYGCEHCESVSDKKKLILSNHLALWDTIASCDVTGSADSSIKNVKPNDISVILNNAAIERIFCNGSMSYKLYCRYILPVVKTEAYKLPSSSPANAAYSLERLIDEWKNRLLE